MMKKILLVLAALCALFFVHTENASADYSTQTDTIGKVTGEQGATYYNVSSWSDMFDAYEDAPDNGTVYLNVKSNIEGSARARKGQEISEGKSVKILGNGNTLYFGESTNPQTSTSVYQAENKTSGFYTSSDRVSSNTTLMLENAKWVNSINYGIFEVSEDAKAKTIYKNVIESNGSTNTGATPIMNRAGAIEFYGTNVFNITGVAGQNWGSGKTDPTKFGSPLTAEAGYANANWIQGGNDITVYDGSTTVNSNAKYQKVTYHFDSKDFNTNLTVKSKAKMYWNMDLIWFLEERAVKTKTWNIEDNAQFIINGTSKSMGKNGITSEHQWFGRDNELAPWTVNIGKKAILDAQTGGVINSENKKYDPSNIRVAETGSLLLRTLSTDWPLFDGNFNGGGLHLGKNSHTVLQANAGSKKKLFGDLANIYLEGDGLPLTASTNFNGSGAIKAPAAKGRLQGNKFSTVDVTPSYSSDVTNLLPKAKYVEFGTGVPIISFGATSLNRLFKFTSSDLPLSGLSAFIPGQDKMSFTVNSNIENPDVTVTASIKEQKYPNLFSYSWKDNANNVQRLTSNPTTIWSRKDSQYDATEDSSGYNYTSNYDENHGLLLQTTNFLKNGTYDDATIDYTLENGPTTDD